MILVDANLLIYAVDEDSSHHRTARRWLERTLSGGDVVGLASIVVLAFLRITTHASIMRIPLAPEAALGYVDEWLALPNVRMALPGRRHWAVLKGLLGAAGTAGNLTSDAHLAALAIELGATVCSADSDFKRFPGLQHENPLA